MEKAFWCPIDHNIVLSPYRTYSLQSAGSNDSDEQTLLQSPSGTIIHPYLLADSHMKALQCHEKQIATIGKKM